MGLCPLFLAQTAISLTKEEHGVKEAFKPRVCVPVPLDKAGVIVYFRSLTNQQAYQVAG